MALQGWRLTEKSGFPGGIKTTRFGRRAQASRPGVACTDAGVARCCRLSAALFRRRREHLVQSLVVERSPRGLLRVAPDWSVRTRLVDLQSLRARPRNPGEIQQR